jgi:hypothetical protein
MFPISSIIMKIFHWEDDFRENIWRNINQMCILSETDVPIKARSWRLLEIIIGDEAEI